MRLFKGKAKAASLIQPRREENMPLARAFMVATRGLCQIISVSPQLSCLMNICPFQHTGNTALVGLSFDHSAVKSPPPWMFQSSPASSDQVGRMSFQRTRNTAVVDGSRSLSCRPRLLRRHHSTWQESGSRELSRLRLETEQLFKRLDVVDIHTG